MSDDISNDLEQQAGQAASGAASGAAAGDPEQAAVGAAQGALGGAPSAPSTPASTSGKGPTASSVVGGALGSVVPAASKALGKEVGKGLEKVGLPPEIASAGGDAAGDLFKKGLNKVVDAVTEVIEGEDALPKASYTVTVEDGPDAHWMVRRMHCSEALSELYVLTLDLVTEDVAADTERMLGANLELTIDRENVARNIRGIVHLVEYIGVTDDRLQIRVEVVPALHLLGQRFDTRLWQNASVVDVVTEVLEAGFGDYDRQLTNNLTATYPPREYIVQYHESDLDFVSRLLEDEGISYWFDHESGDAKEVLVLEDSNDNMVDVSTIDDSPELRLIVDRPDNAEVESLQFLDWTRELTSTAVYQRVFDWLDPTTPLEADAPADGEADTDDRGLRREVYHHGRFVEDDPDPRTIRKLVHRTQRDKLARGFGNVTGLFPGRKFKVVEHPRNDLDREYLVRRVVHVGDCPEVMMGETGSGPRYQSRLECLAFDSDKPFRPAPVTPRPRIYGPQTAIVTGPEGEEIHTDDHGRIKVRFDWDREHSLTDDTSMWIRVAHHWAGPGFGTFFLPRVGMEVLVEFLEGNPDQPLVVGCVYNGDNAISVGVPDNKTQSTIRTKSSPNSDGYNEMRFEDAAGSEEIFVHAQKDYNEVVENNHSTTVHANQTNTVDGDQTETVHGDQTMTVNKNRTVTIKGSQSVTIIGDKANSGVSGSKLNITGDYKLDASNTIEIQAPTHILLTCGGSSIRMTPGVITLIAGGGASLVLDSDSMTVANGGGQLLINGDVHAQSNGGSVMTLDGGAQLAANGGGTVTLTAAVSVTSAKGAAGLSLEGSDAKLAGNATAKVIAPDATLSGSGSATVSGGTVDVAADGVASVSGAMVKLN
jgi:type VI secretion system secreted protein VgrG